MKDELQRAAQEARGTQATWEAGSINASLQDAAQQEPRESDAIARAIAWLDARDICNQPSVDEAIRNLLSDHTEDNAVAVVQAILNAAPKPATVAQRIAQDELETISANRERMGTLRATQQPK